MLGVEQATVIVPRGADVDVFKGSADKRAAFELRADEPAATEDSPVECTVAKVAADEIGVRGDGRRRRRKKMGGWGYV